MNSGDNSKDVGSEEQDGPLNPGSSSVVRTPYRLHSVRTNYVVIRSTLNYYCYILRYVAVFPGSLTAFYCVSRRPEGLTLPHRSLPCPHRFQPERTNYSVLRIEQVRKNSARHAMQDCSLRTPQEAFPSSQLTLLLVLSTTPLRRILSGSIGGARGLRLEVTQPQVGNGQTK
jgi:hypothetical protein